MIMNKIIALISVSIIGLLLCSCSDNEISKIEP